VCVVAMQWAFEAYAFKQAWQIGLLVEPHADRLPDDARASHAAITALAATNAYFVDRPTPGFDAPLYAMYARAVGLAREPVRAASLAIRFAFAAVDRHAADAAARLAAADATAAALAADDPYTRYLRAWLTIGHALHAFHRDELAAADERARAACTALEAVEAAAALAPPQLRDDARCARFMISAHSVVHFATADAARAAAWFVRAEALRPTVPVLLSFEVFHWALLPAPVDDHGVIYDRCVAGLRDAEAAWDSKLWFLYHALAAGCAYRLGRLGDAAGHVHALLGRDWYGNTGALITGDIRPLALRILWRAGWLDAAIAAAERWLAADGPARVELRGLLALALASRGDVAAAQAALDVAIDDAVEHGDQAEMTAIAIRGVEVALAANERAAAEAALASAWELAEDAPGTFAAAIADADRLRLCMVTCEVAGATVALIDRACATLPASLRAPDAWWDARRLRELLAAMPADAARDAALDRVAALDHIAGLDPIAGLIAPA
ncbi:MAG TPA: hypothetical protein VFP84_35020, partial [Kofleriaceae bacterium]|nr:hypothetical protein [Kofleriaceae bacterium]